MKKNNKVRIFAIIAIMAALSYVACMYLSIKITDTLYIHFGNVFCILTALIIGGLEGGISGAIGMGLADVADGIHLSSAPKTIICKLVMCIVVGFFAHKVFKVNETKNKFHLFLSLLLGISVNIIFEIGFGYLYSIVVLGKESAFLAYFISKITSSCVTSVVTLISTYILYFPLYNRIKSYL